MGSPWPAPETDCTPASTGVLIVHGIGVQPPGETRATYGEPIAEMWEHFGQGHRFTTRHCAHHHHHLVDEAATSAAIIDEAYWDDVISKPPSLVKLAAWTLVTLPISLLFTLTRPPRDRRSGVFRPVPWFFWFVRLASGPIVVLLTTVCALMLIMFMAITRSTRIADGIGRALALTLGDAYRFSVERTTSAAMIDRVVENAQRMSELTSRLVVVAHSQGGGITLEAIQHPGWPSMPTHVITLGSGHPRLSFLRRWFSSWPRRVGLAVLAALPLMAGIGWARSIDAISQAAEAGRIDQSEVSGLEGQALGDKAGPTILVGLVVLFFVWRHGRRVAAQIERHSTTWIDLWAAYDLVPDGPLLGGSNPSRKVQNTKSLILDHTTYHTNGAEVISTIIDTIDPRRLERYSDLLDEIRARRSVRLKSSRLVRLIELLSYRGLRMRAPDPEVVRAELRGDTLTADEAAAA